MAVTVPMTKNWLSGLARRGHDLRGEAAGTQKRRRTPTSAINMRLMSLRIGDTFAGYRILRLLGSGGMGKVYSVQHPRPPRHDALKVLRPDVSSNTSSRERFM